MVADPAIRAPELTLETEKRNSESIVRATGRITLATSATLQDTLRELIDKRQRITLDLTKVDYIDSAGLGGLVCVYVHAKRANCALRVANQKQRIKDLFNRSGLACVFDGSSFDVLWEAWSHDN